MTIRSRFEVLRDRAPVSWLRERDIDLLICAELHAGGVLLSRFAELWPLRNLDFSGAWVSYADINGETDLMVAFHDGEMHCIALVENKIAAEFQADQAKRYSERAAHWRQQESTVVATVLICPNDYLSRASTEIFDTAIPYEELISVLRISSDGRSVFLANTLSEGIAAYRRGYVPVPDQGATSVWAAIWGIASNEQPSLHMDRPSEKPGGSNWIYFRQPNGFGDGDAKRCLLVYKAERGQVDMQFSAMTRDQLETLLSGQVEEDMSVVKAAKSASLRLLVPAVDFTAPAEHQLDAIREGLRQAERLRRFYVENSIGMRLRSSHVT